MSGGFTGVDVFFVVSGFLITGLLLREHAQTGRIDLGRFYSRRMRRILPAALATVAVTVVLAAFFLAPLQVPGIAQDGAASALSVGNIRFALQSTDYFAATDPSPFRHFWSLGVEEQFYLVWPGLLIVALGSLRSRLRVALLMGVLLVASLAFAIWLTDVLEPWAFYSLPSRLWQLALGGLLAVAAGSGRTLPGWLAAPIGWLGLAALVAAFVVIDPASPYPGTWALLPAGGAAGLIVAGGRGLGTASLLGWQPLRLRRPDLLLALPVALADPRPARARDRPRAAARGQPGARRSLGHRRGGQLAIHRGAVLARLTVHVPTATRAGHRRRHGDRRGRPRGGHRRHQPRAGPGCRRGSGAQTAAGHRRSAGPTSPASVPPGADPVDDVRRPEPRQPGRGPVPPSAAHRAPAAASPSARRRPSPAAAGSAASLAASGRAPAVAGRTPGTTRSA